jgi:hypothetical protein
MSPRPSNLGIVKSRRSNPLGSENFSGITRIQKPLPSLRYKDRQALHYRLFRNSPLESRSPNGSLGHILESIEFTPSLDTFHNFPKNFWDSSGLLESPPEFWNHKVKISKRKDCCINFEKGVLGGWSDPQARTRDFFR